ncbi:hypothetical protein Dacet_1003 [Denitrovibrio acetiphilus DSM 12809]|uniref:Uncharacterized protein n=1 Tax=Denitrovibrio acetiphilus (strain DSM 12809 / NBRC 114555 / N2460) TaxID=522772 RepID=D4H6R3_DENA2|nr:hypothetical protein [Denitrovibrio acetiphilus]ADD67779.1 hypothetical protein Dacet_1003 [Denitrovibrio acetiphilus DSM 12809]
MNDKTIRIMQEQLVIVEKYMKDLEEASDKKTLMEAISTCSHSIKSQYPDLEDIADDYCDRSQTDEELKRISDTIGKLLSTEVTKFYGKMGQYMADSDFMETFAEFDIVVGNNPLFGVNQFGGDVAAEVSKSIAGGLDGMATQMIADSTEIDESSIKGITNVMDSFLGLSQRYVAKMQEASTARKAVTATDAFVSSIKKMIPEMKQHSDQLKLLMAKKEKPEQILNMAESLRKTLGDDLKAVMKDKEELLADHKVQKSVSKLGAVLNEVPF